MPDQIRHFYFHMLILLKKCYELNKTVVLDTLNYIEQKDICMDFAYWTQYNFKSINLLKPPFVKNLNELMLMHVNDWFLLIENPVKEIPID